MECLDFQIAPVHRSPQNRDGRTPPPRIHMHMHVTLQPQIRPARPDGVAAISQFAVGVAMLKAMFVAEQMRIVQNRFEIDRATSAVRTNGVICCSNWQTCPADASRFPHPQRIGGRGGLSTLHHSRYTSTS